MNHNLPHYNVDGFNKTCFVFSFYFSPHPNDLHFTSMLSFYYGQAELEKPVGFLSFIGQLFFLLNFRCLPGL